MANENVREPVGRILASIVKPVPQPRPTTNRDRFSILEAIFEELQAAGVQIDIAQLDWAIREYEDRLRDLIGQRQYAYEEWRKAKDADEYRRTEKREADLARKFGACQIHDSSIDPGGIR